MSIIPESMQAVQLDQAGGPLEIRQIPVPRPGPGEVLIRIAAAPINPSDLSFLRGTNALRKPFPAVPGLEGSGVVVDRGSGLLPGLWMGRRVACAAAEHGGTWAEYLVTPAMNCFPLKKGISLEQGAMLIVNPMTALALFDIVTRDHHRAVVSTAAAGTLGGMIRRMGQEQGIPVINIVRRVEQAAMLRSQGVEVLLSEDPDFIPKLKSLAARFQATLFLDAVAGEMTPQLLAAAPAGSTVLLFANLSEELCRIDPRVLISGDKRLEGFYLANWTSKKNMFQKLRNTGKVQRLARTVLNTPMRRRFPLSETQQAVDLYSQTMTGGKVLLMPGIKKH